MSRASVRLTGEAREQARNLQQQYPTFSEALLSVQWALEDDPTAGMRATHDGYYIYRRDPAPGSPGIRVTYRYRAGEVVIVGVEATG